MTKKQKTVKFDSVEHESIYDESIASLRKGSSQSKSALVCPKGESEFDLAFFSDSDEEIERKEGE